MSFLVHTHSMLFIFQAADFHNFHILFTIVEESDKPYGPPCSVFWHACGFHTDLMMMSKTSEKMSHANNHMTISMFIQP